MGPTCYGWTHMMWHIINLKSLRWHIFVRCYGWIFIYCGCFKTVWQLCIYAIVRENSRRRGEGGHGFTAKWHVKREHINSILMTCNYTQIWEVPLIGHTVWEICFSQICFSQLEAPLVTWIWIVTHHQYGISALVSQTSHVAGKPVVVLQNVDHFHMLHISCC